MRKTEEKPTDRNTPMNSYRKPISFVIALCLAALLASCSLAEDVTPPPDYRTPTPDLQPVSAGPAAAPDLSQGAAIYAEKCAPCHGQKGLGDGPQAAQLSAPVAAIGSADVARAARPSDWFTIVSQGRIDRYMPGFSGSLSEQQIWDVLAYVYSLSDTSVIPTPLAAAPTAGAAQPTAPGITALNPAGTPLAASTLAGTPTVTVSVTGKITNGSGGNVPAGLVVTLHGYDAMQEAYTQTTTSAADGAYAFPRVALPEGRVLMVTVAYQDATFGSEIAHGSNDGDTVSLPVTVYDATKDASKVSIERMHVFFDFSTAGAVQVVELVIASNAGNQTVVAPAPGQPILKFALPKGATNLQFQQGALGKEYVETADGFGDTQSIAPGSGTHEVLFAFNLPYQNKLDVNLPVVEAVQSAVIMVPKGGVTLKSSQLTDSGERDVQGVSFKLYTADNLAANSSIALTLNGNPNAAGATSLIGPTETPALVIGLSAFVLTLLGAGLWLYQSRKMRLAPEAGAAASSPAPQPDEPEQDADSLIDAITALDDMFQAGKLPEAAYRERRTELKQRLAKALEASDDRNAQPD